MEVKGSFQQALGKLQLQPDDYQLHLIQALQRHKVPGAWSDWHCWWLWSHLGCCQLDKTCLNLDQDVWKSWYSWIWGKMSQNVKDLSPFTIECVTCLKHWAGHSKCFTFLQTWFDGSTCPLHLSETTLSSSVWDGYSLIPLALNFGWLPMRF